MAAASLGQVYKARLRETGEEVALKVQRPGVLELVALDLVLGRRGILIADKLFPRVRRLRGILHAFGCVCLVAARQLEGCRIPRTGACARRA